MNLLRVVTRDALKITLRQRIQKLPPFPMMPRYEAKVVEQYYRDSKRGILELGGGGSTIYALSVGKKVTTIETDSGYVAALRDAADSLGKAGMLRVIYVDIGRVGKYGFPLFHPLRKRSTIRSYGARYLQAVRSVLQSGDIDVVNIDGRWRVGSALTCAEQSKYHSAKIIFDDYAGREWYRAVESCFNVEIHGRLAILSNDKPGCWGMRQVDEEWFLDPR